MVERSEASITREAIYDAEIAPVLRRLRDRCTEAGINFMGVTEWDTVYTGGEWDTHGSMFTLRNESKCDGEETPQTELFSGLVALYNDGSAFSTSLGPMTPRPVDPPDMD